MFAQIDSALKAVIDQLFNSSTNTATADSNQANTDAADSNQANNTSTTDSYQNNINTAGSHRTNPYTSTVASYQASWGGRYPQYWWCHPCPPEEAGVTVDTQAGSWGSDDVNDMLQSAPAVYTSFNMGKLSDQNKLKSRWHVYLVTKSPSENDETSAYSMLHALIATLHGLELGQEDVLTFKRVKNRPSLIGNRAGYQCHQLEFWLLMTWPDQVTVSSLDDFLRYQAQGQASDSEQVLIAADGTLPSDES